MRESRSQGLLWNNGLIRPGQIFAFIFFSLASSLQALATEYECKSGADVRYVRVDYPGLEHLCEVSVTHDGKEREVKWYADVDSTFCSTKIEELIGKYQNQWGYSCAEWPDHDGIDQLSPRQRKYLDKIVKNNLRTEYKKQSYTLLGTRALIGSFIAPSLGSDTSIASNLLAFQLFMGRDKQNSRDLLADASSEIPVPRISIDNDNQPLPVANRLIFVQDDGENYETLATLDDLSSVIEVEKEGYTLDSVIIDSLNANGELNVSTLVAAPDDDPSAVPSCFGRKRFKTTERGLEALSEHQIICDL